MLVIEKETQPVQIEAPTEALIDEKIVVTEKVAVKEEDAKVQPRSPITILSKDEGYMLEGDEFLVKT